MTRRRLAMAMVLGGLALAAPFDAAAKPHEPARDKAPPGQAKKETSPVASRAPEPEVVERAAPSAAEPAVAETPKKSARRTPNPNSAAGRQAATAPEPQAVEPAAAAPPAAAPAAAPAPTAAPAVSPAPAAQRPRRTPGARRRAAGRRSASRRGAQSPSAVPAPLPAPIVGTPAAAAARPDPRAARTRRPVGDAAPERDREPRTVTRFVTEAVEVVPAPLRYAAVSLGTFAAVLLLGLLLSTWRGSRLERQRRRLMADVGLLQSALLPELPETVGPAAVSAAYRPADGLAAGGDFYDAFALDADTTCVLLGDVAGHGRDAIPVTALVRYTIRAYLEGGMTPRQALQVAGRVLQPQLRETHVTVVVAVYDRQTGLLTFASAGHPPPVVTSDDAPPVLALSSPALGLGVPTGRRQVTLPLPPGAVACFSTDGLADVLVEGRRLGPDRLAAEVRGLAAGDGAGELLARLVQRSTDQPDDMAAIVLRPPNDAPSPRTGKIEELEVDADDVRRGRLARYLAEYRVDGAVAEAATAAVARVLAHAHAVVIEINHDAAGATVSVVDTPDVVALPLAPVTPADEFRAAQSS